MLQRMKVFLFQWRKVDIVIQEIEIYIAKQIKKCIILHRGIQLLRCNGCD